MIIRFFLPLLFLPLFAYSTEPAKTMQAQQLYLKGAKLLQQGKYGDAHTLFIECYEKAQNDQLIELKALAAALLSLRKQYVQIEEQTIEKILFAEEYLDEFHRLALLGYEPSEEDHQAIKECHKICWWRFEDALPKVQQYRDKLNCSPAGIERALCHLPLAFYAYHQLGNGALFHAHCQQTLTEMPSLRRSALLLQKLAGLYGSLAAESDDASPWHYETATYLCDSLSSSKSSRILTKKEGLLLLQSAKALISSSPSLRRLTPIEHPDEDVIERARLVLRLYTLFFNQLEGLKDIVPAESLAAHYGGAVTVASALQQLLQLEQLAVLSQRCPAIPKKHRVKAELLTANLYMMQGRYPQASLLSAMYLNDTDNWCSTMATLVFSKAGWRSLCAEGCKERAAYLPYVEMLGQLMADHSAITEPLHAEAAIEQAFAMAAAERAHPDYDLIRAMFLQRNLDHYFAKLKEDSSPYQEQLNRYPHLAMALEGYRMLAQAHTLADRGFIARRHGLIEEMIDNHKKALEIYSQLQENGQLPWHYLKAEAEAGQKRLLGSS